MPKSLAKYNSPGACCLQDTGVSLVEDLSKARQPLTMGAVYFIRPTPQSVDRLIADFCNTSTPIYPTVHVFFSSKVRAGMFRRQETHHAFDIPLTAKV